MCANRALGIDTVGLEEQRCVLGFKRGQKKRGKREVNGRGKNLQEDRTGGKIYGGRRKPGK